MDMERQCSHAELGQVMDRYSATVYRLAYSRLRSAADAEDVSQEVFLRYYQKRPVFETEVHRKAWLLRVTVNRANSYAASAWVRHMVPLEDTIPMPEPEETLLDDALSALPAKDRMLLHLYYYEDLSTREIAEILKRKESTVRTQLTRARQRLAKMIKGGEYEKDL